MTVNTIDEDNNFSINRIAQIIPLKEIYFGLPDPTLSTYCDHDPFLSSHSVHQYGETQQIAILQQNASIYKTSPQNIANSPFYAGLRISHLLHEGLNKLGYSLTFDEVKRHKNSESLSSYLATRYDVDFHTVYKDIQTVLSSAFNKKYGAYSYTNDTRSVDPSWINRFHTVVNTVLENSINKCDIIDVGVGSGHEAVKLFGDCQNVTFVDIASNGLQLIREHIPNACTHTLNAEHLSEISDRAYDLYVSLRTYNSSFFDITKALKEAFRVLRCNGTIIISVANGFLRIEDKTIIPGLIIPRTDFVDIYRGVNTAKYINRVMTQVGFDNIYIIPTPTEIYVTARKTLH